MITYIKYLLPKTSMNTFLTTNDAEKLKPSIVEIVGYKVDENDEYIYISNDKNGIAFKRVVTIPKNAISESTEVAPSTKYTAGEIVEIHFIDTQMTSNNITMTLDKLKKAPKPPICSISGFIVSENEKDIIIAAEKDEDGKYKGINITPKKFIVEIN